MNNPEQQEYLLKQLQENAYSAQRSRQTSSRTGNAVPLVKETQSNSKKQRVFVKISTDYENQANLSNLKATLQQHRGDLQVVLFYEREQKTVALHAQYNVKPSEALLQSVEGLMGTGAIKVQ
jgi:DNA polymerase-3 subunit alpha